MYARILQACLCRKELEYVGAEMGFPQISQINAESPDLSAHISGNLREKNRVSRRSRRLTQRAQIYLRTSAAICGKKMGFPQISQINAESPDLSAHISGNLREKNRVSRRSRRSTQRAQIYLRTSAAICTKKMGFPQISQINAESPHLSAHISGNLREKMGFPQISQINAESPHLSAHISGNLREKMGFPQISQINAESPDLSAHISGNLREKNRVSRRSRRSTQRAHIYLRTSAAICGKNGFPADHADQRRKFNNLSGK